MKLLITGGHLTPALAVIEELQKNKPGIDIIFVGRQYALDSEKTLSWEYREITGRHIRFINLFTGRLNRLIDFGSLINFLKIPFGFINSFIIIVKEKPNIILSFGGYIAFPIAIVGYFSRIPVYTHEQTINPGLANRIIAKLSKKVFLSFAETEKYFPASKTVVTGNPIRPSISKINKKPFEINKDKPVIYITGGSLGAHSVNEIIKKIIIHLLDRYIVIHQTGETKKYHDYEDILEIKKSLPKNLADRYFPVKHFHDEEIGYIFNLADLVIGRSGANTFFELVSLKKPAILIPLPWSAGNEQEAHAKIFAKAETGEIFNQKEDSRKLIELIDKVMIDKEKFKANFHTLNYLSQKDAAQNIVNQIITNN